MLKTLKRRKRPRRGRKLKRFVEFKGIRRSETSEYRRTVQKMYDGPAGAILAIGSVLSLHQPLIGHLLKSKKFDTSRFRNILDVGSGAGQILRYLVRTTHPDARIVGFDLSHEMLRRARTRVKSRRPIYVSGDMMSLPFANESFDCITCGWVIEHLSDPTPGLREFERVLAPGGRMLLLTTEDTVLGALTSRTWKCRTYNRNELQAAFDEAGLGWKEELWFTPVHKFLKAGGILVEASKPE